MVAWTLENVKTIYGTEYIKMILITFNLSICLVTWKLIFTCVCSDINNSIRGGMIVYMYIKIIRSSPRKTYEH